MKEFLLRKYRNYVIMIIGMLGLPHIYHYLVRIHKKNTRIPKSYPNLIQELLRRTKPRMVT